MPCGHSGSGPAGRAWCENSGYPSTEMQCTLSWISCHKLLHARTCSGDMVSSRIRPPCGRKNRSGAGTNFRWQFASLTRCPRSSSGTAVDLPSSWQVIVKLTSWRQRACFKAREISHVAKASLASRCKLSNVGKSGRHRSSSAARVACLSLLAPDNMDEIHNESGRRDRLEGRKSCSRTCESLFIQAMPRRMRKAFLSSA